MDIAHVAVATLLLDRGADVNRYINRMYASTPLFIASLRGYTSAVRPRRRRGSGKRRADGAAHRVLEGPC